MSARRILGAVVGLGLGYSPIKAAREAGVQERRGTYSVLSIAGVGNLKDLLPSTEDQGSGLTAEVYQLSCQRHRWVTMWGKG